MIGGNINATIEIRTTTKNELGEAIKSWHPVLNLYGWLDFISGEAKYNTYNAKIEESTHVFMCDYLEIGKEITNENSRLIINNEIYDIKYIDNPMFLNEHLEIFVSYTGGK